MSWGFSVPTTTEFVQFEAENVEYIDYLVYQVDEYCGGDAYDCYDYWDAYEASILNGDGCGSGDSWDLGPPAIGYFAAEIEQTTDVSVGDPCYYPASESSQYYEKDPDTSEYYESEYWAYLNTGDFTGRYIVESVSGTYQDCTDLGGGITAITVENSDFNNGYDWIPDGDEYGNGDWDYVGVSVGYAEAVQGILESDWSCSAFSFSQAMVISSCSAPTIPSYTYDAGHTLAIQMFETSIMSYRGSASGAAQ